MRSNSKVNRSCDTQQSRKAIIQSDDIESDLKFLKQSQDIYPYKFNGPLLMTPLIFWFREYTDKSMIDFNLPDRSTQVNVEHSVCIYQCIGLIEINLFFFCWSPPPKKIIVLYEVEGNANNDFFKMSLCHWAKPLNVVIGSTRKHHNIYINPKHWCLPFQEGSWQILHNADWKEKLQREKLCASKTSSGSFRLDAMRLIGARVWSTFPIMFVWLILQYQQPFGFRSRQDCISYYTQYPGIV